MIQHIGKGGKTVKIRNIFITAKRSRNNDMNCQSYKPTSFTLTELNDKSLAFHPLHLEKYTISLDFNGFFFPQYKLWLPHKVLTKTESKAEKQCHHALVKVSMTHLKKQPFPQLRIPFYTNHLLNGNQAYLAMINFNK